MLGPLVGVITLCLFQLNVGKFLEERRERIIFSLQLQFVYVSAEWHNDKCRCAECHGTERTFSELIGKFSK